MGQPNTAMVTPVQPVQSQSAMAPDMSAQQRRSTPSAPSMSPAQMLQSIQANMSMVQRQWAMINAQQDAPNKTSALQYLTTQMQRLMSMHESVLNASRNSVTPDTNSSGSSMNAPLLNQTVNPLAPPHPPGEPRSWDSATTTPHSYPLSANQWSASRSVLWQAQQRAMRSPAPISFHAANKTGIQRTKSHAAQRWMAVVVMVLTVQLALTQQVRP